MHCTTENCDRAVYAYTICAMHYQRYRLHGKTVAGMPVPPPCSVDGCDRPMYGKSLCNMHWQRQDHHGSTADPHRKRSTLPCSVDGCERVVQARTYCSMHYQRVVKNGSIERPRRKHKDSYIVNGYVLINVEGQRAHVPEHRLVMEQMLGRGLRRGESVHHKNAIKTDNRPENLELWVGWQPTGCRVEDLVAFAREVLDLYG